MKKNILIIFVCMLAFYTDVKALMYDGCEVSEISKLKSYVTNINLSYDYYINGDIPYFSVTINNLTPDMYFIDSVRKKTYFYKDTKNGEITIKDYASQDGMYNFYSAKKECYGVKLGTKYFNFPKYNYYHNSSDCADIPNYSLCKKWANVGYSQGEFHKKIDEYKKSLNSTREELKISYESNWFDKIFAFYEKYYYIFLSLIIIVCGIVLIIDKKKNRFKL